MWVKIIAKIQVIKIIICFCFSLKFLLVAIILKFLRQVWLSCLLMNLLQMYELYFVETTSEFTYVIANSYW
jgi:hypothetical protein